MCCTVVESGNWILTSAGMSGDCEDTSDNAATNDEENSLRVFHDVKRVVGDSARPAEYECELFRTC